MIIFLSVSFIATSRVACPPVLPRSVSFSGTSATLKFPSSFAANDFAFCFTKNAALLTGIPFLADYTMPVNVWDCDCANEVNISSIKNKELCLI